MTGVGTGMTPSAESAQTTIEYAVVLALVAAGVVATLGLLTGSIGGLYDAAVGVL